jgi:hypothetical protein
MASGSAGGEIRNAEELRHAAKARGRELIRRRRRVVRWSMGGTTVAIMAAVALIIVFGPRSSVTSSTGTSKHPESSLPQSATTTPNSSLSTVNLPTTGLFNTISVVNGTLDLTGQTGADSNTCALAAVNPLTLKVGVPKVLNCNDPALIGDDVGIVVTYVFHDNNATVSIATVKGAKGEFTTSPPIFTFANVSDTGVVTAYGGGWLWIYDVATTNGAELVQVSATNGQVENTVKMPKLYRPIMAADDAGVWIGNSIEGSQANTLYRVAPDSGAPVTVVSGADDVYWMIGDGAHLWAGIGPPGDSQQEIWRLDGTNPQPVFKVADQGFDPWTVVGDESDGLWTMQWDPKDPPLRSPPTRQQIIRIDPDSGTETVVATVPPVPVPSGEGPSGLLSGQATVFDGSLYVLEPPFRQNGYLGYTALIRVPSSAEHRTVPTTTIASSPAVLRGDGLGDERFGESQTTVTAELDGEFGSPTATQTYSGDCGIDAMVRWGEISTFYSGGSFVGYRVLGASATYPSGGGFYYGGVGHQGVTQEGLRVGDTLTEAQSLYGSALTTSTAQGGTYDVATSTGKLLGYLSGVPGQSSTPLVIESIGAGLVGCPAASP